MEDSEIPLKLILWARLAKISSSLRKKTHAIDDMEKRGENVEIDYSTVELFPAVYPK